MNAKSLIARCLIVIGISLLFLNGYNDRKSMPKHIVALELDYLVDSQTQSTGQQALLKDIVPADEKNEKTDEELAQIFALFFEDFSYKITDSTITDEKATVDVNLTTIDATALAKDFISQSIVKQIQGNAAPSGVTYSSNDYYHSLYLLLSSNEYKAIESNCTISLTKIDGKWQINPEQNLEDILTGGFVSAVSNPNLFTPEEIAIIYLDTIKAFDKEQMNQFLSLDSLFAADDDYKRTISQALANQILRHYNYSIINSNISNNEAQVSASITSYDANSIINNFSTQMASYTSTAQALEDGVSGRVSKANSVLLDCINSNTSTTINEVTLHLTNDGISWTLQMDETLPQAILGNVREATRNVN